MLLGFLGTGFFSYSRGVFLPSLAEELAQGSRMQISLGFSGAAVVGAIIAPYLGHILDTKSPKRVILLGIIVVALSYLLLANTQTIWQFYLIVSIGFGVGMSCMSGMAWHRSIIFWFDRWRGRAIAFAVMGASMAGIMMPPLVTALVDNYGWRTGYTAFAAITLIALLPVVYLFFRDRPEDIGEVRDGHRYLSNHPEDEPSLPQDTTVWTTKMLLRSPAFWSIGLIFGAMVCVFTAVMMHLFGHLLDLGLASKKAALVLSVTALFAALGKPLVGFLADFFGARITVWLALISQAISLLLFTQAESFWACIVAASVYGFGYSGMSPLRSFALSTSIGSTSFALASGVLRRVELPFVLLASPIAGFIYDATGSYNDAFYILAGLIALACIGPFFIRIGGAAERRALKTQQS
ncbi:MAG: MFS transporter [Gammaproteobacteria bacterium]|nr:MFS transporter [Gammaproteobacteria bacterium]MCH1550261.1 MFS transporter [Pseudomonadales bacterium]